MREKRAGERTQTVDLLITSQLLYQLSYAGTKSGLKVVLSSYSSTLVFINFGKNKHY